MQIALTFLLLCTCVGLTAIPDRPLTLADLTSIALENHPSTRQTWWNAQRAAAALGNSSSSYYPKVNFNAHATNGRDFKFLTGPDITYTILGADLSLTMLLWDGGQRAADVEAARMALSAANWHADWNIQKVLVRVLENAYSALHAQETLEATKLSLEDAEKVVNATRELNKAGLNPVSDVFTSQASLAEMRLELAEQKSYLDIAKGKLAASLGIPAETPLIIAPLNPLPEQTQALLALAADQRADLLEKRARLSESMARLDKARVAHRPKLSFSGSGGVSHAYHDRTKGAQYRISFDCTVPIFDGFENFYQKRMAYADMELSQEELADLQLEISLEVLTWSRSLVAAQEMLPAADDALQNALRAYDSVHDKYKAGKEGIAEFSNAQRQLAGARIRYSQVKTKWLVAIAKLAYATGTLAPYMETPCPSF